MLYLTCKGQLVTVETPDKIATGFINVNVVKFSFCERWSGMVKTAQFTQRQEDGKEKTYNVVIDDLTGSATMPNEIVAGELKISAFGVDPDTGMRITSIPVKIVVEKSGFVDDGETPIPPTPDLYTQLVNFVKYPVIPRIGDNGNWFVGDEDTGIAVQGYVSEGEIDILPTMPVDSTGQDYNRVDVTEYMRGEIVAGKVYTVTWNGVPYQVTAEKAGETGVVIEHRNPRFTIFCPEGFAYINMQANEQASIRIQGEGEIIHKIDPKFLPDEIGGMPKGGAPNQALVTGGNGVAKWMDRDFYDGADEVCLQEIALTGINVLPSANYSAIMEIAAFYPVEGETYAVWWNGKAYEITAEGAGVGVVYLNTKPTEETPFSLQWIFGEEYVGVRAYNEPDATLKITRPGFKKLDPKFLPDGGFGWTEEGGKAIVFEASWTAEEYEAEAGELMLSSPLGAPLEAGNTYSVTWCGVEYECECVAVSPTEGVTMPMIGNFGVMMGGADTGEPFVIAGAYGEMQAAGITAMVAPVTEPTFPLTVKVTTDCEIVHKIDPKYISSTPVLYVDSSTIDGFALAVYKDKELTRRLTFTEGTELVMSGAVLVDVYDNERVHFPLAVDIFSMGKTIYFHSMLHKAGTDGAYEIHMVNLQFTDSINLD